MKSQDDSGEKQPRPPAQPYPRGLDLIAALDKLHEMDDDEAIAFFSAYLQNMRNCKDALRVSGIDPHQHIQMVERELANFKEKVQKNEEAQEELLQSTADLGQSSRNLVGRIEAVVNEAIEEKPFDPEVQDWKEKLKELRKQYPKID